MLAMMNMRRGLIRPFDRVSPCFMPIANHHRTDEVMGYQPRPRSPLEVVYSLMRTPRKIPNISADFRRDGGGHSEVGGGRWVGVSRGSAGLARVLLRMSAKKRNRERDNKPETWPKVLIPTYMRFILFPYSCVQNLPTQDCDGPLALIQSGGNLNYLCQ